MDQRKELILNTIIKEHIKTGAPVGSGVLVEKYRINASPATVRNEMAALEEEGFIVQPHTSAGRIPTEKAYYRYLEKAKSGKLGEKEQAALNDMPAGRDEAAFRQTAKNLADLTNNAVIWAFHRHNVYYTGLSNLFSQPEFARINVIYDISAVIDRVDELVDEIFDQVDFGPQVLLGSRNPFGQMFGTVLAKYKAGGDIGIFSLVGPLRMDYRRNLQLVKHIYNKINP